MPKKYCLVFLYFFLFCLLRIQLENKNEDEERNEKNCHYNSCTCGVVFVVVHVWCVCVCVCVMYRRLFPTIIIIKIITISKLFPDALIVLGLLSDGWALPRNGRKFWYNFFFYRNEERQGVKESCAHGVKERRWWWWKQFNLNNIIIIQIFIGWGKNVFINAR